MTRPCLQTDGVQRRSIDTPEGISLLGAVVSPGMVPPGTAGSLCGLIRDVAAALAKLPDDSRETDELLQSAFVGGPRDHSGMASRIFGSSGLHATLVFCLLSPRVVL